MTKAEVRARLAGEMQDGIKLPGTIAIARVLLSDWVRTS
jgi:hypothetical protein